MNQKFLLSVVGMALLVAVPSLFGQVSMDLTGVGNGVVDYGVYVSPYTATVNGVANTNVICDDFADETYFNESWTANVSTVANLGTVMWDPTPLTNTPQTPNQQTLYKEMAYLAYQLPGSSAATQSAISFAIWDLSDPSGPSGVSGWSSASGMSATEAASYSAFLNDSADTSGVQYWVNLAQSQYGTLTAAQLSDVMVYTPIGSDPITCGGGTCNSTPPQEFLAIATPEPATLAELGLDIGGLAFLIVFLRRRSLRFS